MNIAYGIIYKVTNSINGKCYIGQTIKTLDLMDTLKNIRKGIGV